MNNTKNTNATTVPISEKWLLRIRETAVYNNIGINKIDVLLRKPTSPFVLFVWKKKPMKRVEFKKFIQNQLVI